MTTYLLIRTSHVLEHHPLHLALNPIYEKSVKQGVNEYKIRIFKNFIEVYGDDLDDVKYKTFNWCSYVFLLNGNFEVISFPEWFIEKLIKILEELDEYDFISFTTLFKVVGIDGFGYALFNFPFFNFVRFLKFIEERNFNEIYALLQESIVIETDVITNPYHEAQGRFYVWIRLNGEVYSFMDSYYGFYIIWLFNKLKVIEDKDFRSLCRLNPEFARYFM